MAEFNSDDLRAKSPFDTLFNKYGFSHTGNLLQGNRIKHQYIQHPHSEAIPDRIKAIARELIRRGYKYSKINDDEHHWDKSSHNVTAVISKGTLIHLRLI